MPILDGLAGFIVATEFHAGAEEGGAALQVEAAPELFGHALEPGGGDGGQIALGQFGFEPAQLFRERLETFAFRGERAVHEVLPFDSPQVLDEMLVLAAPEDEGAFGDADLLGDAGEAHAFGAQLDKFLNGFLVFHFKPFRVPTRGPFFGDARR